MNLKNLTDEEISEMLKTLTSLQEERLKEKEKATKHYYEFTGTWSWGVWARSKEEATKYFKDADIEDFEIWTDEYHVERYE